MRVLASIVLALFCTMVPAQRTRIQDRGKAIQAVKTKDLFELNQPITENEIQAAIAKGAKTKPAAVGVTLHSAYIVHGIQTVLCGGPHCAGEPYIRAYTPLMWIEYQAAQAKRELRQFTLADVEEEMRAPVLHVVATPTEPENNLKFEHQRVKVITRLVLMDKAKKTTVQPKTLQPGTKEGADRSGSLQSMAAQATFALTDVDSLRNPEGELLVGVVDEDENSYYTVNVNRFARPL